MTLSPTPDSATECTRSYQKRLFSVIVVGLVLATCATTSAADATDDLFVQYSVETGTANHQTVLPGYFRGGATADIILVRVDERNVRRVQMYGFDGGSWDSVLEATLRPHVLFVDVINIQGRDRLITYEHGRLNWFDPESAAEQMLLDVETSYNFSDAGILPQVDITRDLNDDGRDDLLVPDVNGFWVSVQRGDGSFSEAVRLGPPEPFLDNVGLDDSGSNEATTYGEMGITAFTAPLYASRVHAMDYNQDGRVDLVFWNKDHFDVHYQNERGLFSTEATTFTTDVTFDADGVYSHAFAFSDAGVGKVLFGLGRNVDRTMLHSLRDMNGDDVSDLVTLTLAGRSPLKQRSTYNVHFGKSTPDGIVFSRDASTAIYPKGKAGGGQLWGYASRWFEDLAGDGEVDIVLRDVTFGIGGMIRALTLKSIGIDLEIYRMDRGIYPDKSNFSHKIRTKGDTSGSPFLPAVLLGDVNGDGHADLLTGGRTRKELDVFLGVPGPDVFALSPQKVTVEMPADGERAWLVDLNLDNKQDIIMHPRSNGEPHRLTILIAR